MDTTTTSATAAPAPADTIPIEKDTLCTCSHKRGVHWNGSSDTHCGSVQCACPAFTAAPAAAATNEEPAPAAEAVKILSIYRDEYTRKKQLEADLELTEQSLRALQARLDPFYSDEIKTLRGEGIQLTRSVATTAAYDIKTAVQSDVIRAILDPFKEIVYDHKAAMAAKPILVGLLDPYKTERRGKPVFRATLKG